MKVLKSASFVHHKHSVTESPETKLTLVDASENYARLVQIQLIPPETIDSDSLMPKS